MERVAIPPVERRDVVIEIVWSVRVVEDMLMCGR